MNIKENYLKLIYILFVIAFFGCSKDIEDFGEQYKKTVYLVNSRDMLVTNSYFFGQENNVMISAYCAGSLPTSKDVTINLKIDSKSLDSLNHLIALGNPLYEDKLLLPEANYNLPDMKIKIKAKEQYGTIFIPFNANGLDPDISYALPVKIESCNEGYDINMELNTIIVEFKMVNEFSGIYNSSSIELPKNTIRSVQPIVKAISENQVRLPIHNLSDDKDKLDTNFMLLTIGEDGESVTITPWRDAQITDLGGSKYNSKKMSFELNYSFIDSKGTEFTIFQKLNNIEYNEADE